MRRTSLRNETVFVTADLHLFHLNEAKRRGFSCIKDYHDEIYRRLKKEIPGQATLVITGDICMKESQAAESAKFIKTLGYNKVIIVPGNHDRDGSLLIFESFGFVTTDSILESEDWVFCHYNMQTWNRKHYGVKLVHGHSHGTGTKEETKIDAFWMSYDKPVQIH